MAALNGAAIFLHYLLPLPRLLSLRQLNISTVKAFHSSIFYNSEKLHKEKELRQELYLIYRDRSKRAGSPTLQAAEVEFKNYN